MKKFFSFLAAAAMLFTASCSNDDLGENEAISLGIVNWKMDDITSRYFDFEKFGEDLTEEESYCELPDGRIAYLCY